MATLSIERVPLLLERTHVRALLNYRHAAGDNVLQEFSSQLQSAMRQSDMVARWGGEGFLVICHCPTEESERMLERLCATVRDHRYRLSTGQ